jgi:hypothetical protein
LIVVYPIVRFYQVIRTIHATSTMSGTDEIPSYTPPVKHQVVSVCMELPNGELTDKLPLKIKDMVQFDEKNKATLLPLWQKTFLARIFDSLKIYFDLHNLDSDNAHIETLQTLFTTHEGTSLHLDTLSFLFVDPADNMLHFTLLQQFPDRPTLDIRLRFIGRAQRLLTEACLRPTQISISDPINSPELLTKISVMLQSLLLSQSSTSTSPSTPITRNTTPTLDISADQSPAFTPTGEPPALHPLFRTQHNIGTVPPDTQVLLCDDNREPHLSRPVAGTVYRNPFQPLPPTQHSSTAPHFTHTQHFSYNINNNPAPDTSAPAPSSSNTSSDPQPNSTPAQTPSHQQGQQTDPPPGNPNSTPPWDTFNREAYGYIHTPEQYINSQPQRAVLESNTWTHARFDLNKIERVLHLPSGTFLPWYTPRPDHGHITCFPVKLPLLFMVKNYFIRSFNVGLAAVRYSRTDPKQMKIFGDTFPTFGPDDAKNYFKWHNSVVEYGQRFGIFIPPATYGVWFDSLCLSVQNDIQNTFRFVLSGAIRSRTLQSLRQENPRLYNKIQNCSPDGYVLLSDLARSAGNHPLLRSYSVFQSEPRQSLDTPLDYYLIEWQQFIQNQLLDGVIYSDRYFHQQFLSNLHPQARNRIGQYLHQTVLSVPLSQPLPPALAPDRFSDFIEQHLDQFSNSYLLSKTPRQISSGNNSTPTQAVRALTIDDFSSSTPLDSLVVAALRQPGPCLFCRSHKHQFIKCPSFDAFRQQPKKKN